MQNKKVKYFFEYIDTNRRHFLPAAPKKRQEEGKKQGKKRERLEENGGKTRELSKKMAERGGFEPPNGKNPLTVFETAAFDRSAISPVFDKKGKK